MATTITTLQSTQQEEILSFLEDIIGRHSREEIYSTLFRYIARGDIEPCDTIAIARDEDGIVQGAMHYSTSTPHTVQELHDALPRYVKRYNLSELSTIFGLPSYGFSGHLIDIHRLESFQKGTGRALVRTVQNEETECVLLRSNTYAYEFYKKCGFQMIGMSYGTLPIMIWRRDGQY